MLIFSALLFVCFLAIAITIHEAAHCYMADFLGDPTPRSLGRLTLSPVAHLDPIGSILLPLIAFISQSPLLFGWGKPSPFDPYNLKNPKRDTALIALAGPASNLLLAIVLSLALHFVTSLFFFQVLALFIQLNISLAVFNLLPVPPLDGSKIIGLLMSHESALRYQNVARQHSILLLFIIILPIFGGHSLASIFTTPLIKFLMDLLIPVV